MKKLLKQHPLNRGAGKAFDLGRPLPSAISLCNHTSPSISPPPIYPPWSRYFGEGVGVKFAIWGQVFWYRRKPSNANKTSYRLESVEWEKHKRERELKRAISNPHHPTTIQHLSSPNLNIFTIPQLTPPFLNKLTTKPNHIYNSLFLSIL